MIRFRSARPQHLDGIVRTYTQLFSPAEQGLPASFFRDALRTAGTVAVVAIDGGRLHGYCIGVAYPGRPDTIYCASFAVQPKMQGRGIGTRMYEEFLQHARHAGYLHVVGDFTPASERIARRARRPVTEHTDGRTTRIESEI